MTSGPASRLKGRRRLAGVAFLTVLALLVWLSLALYAKSQRTPWVLDGLEEGTAYAGLGLSMDTDATSGQLIVRSLTTPRKWRTSSGSCGR